MYVPPKYKISESEAWNVVALSGAGVFVVATSAGLRSVIAPIMVSEDRQAVLGHVARGNSWWSQANDGDEVIGIFNPTSAYISPSFYPSKHENPAVVPTWDYLVAEISGTLTIHDDPQWVEQVVRGLTDKFEAGRGDPWSVDDAPIDYVRSLVLGVVGFEIRVTSVTGSAKLSQNKSKTDRDAVSGHLALASEREKLLATYMNEYT